MRVPLSETSEVLALLNERSGMLRRVFERPTWSPSLVRPYARVLRTEPGESPEAPLTHPSPPGC